MSAASATMPLVEADDHLTRLFAEHHRRVLLAAYRITGSMADAEDVAQTVFLRLVRSDDLAVKNVESYLYRSAINGALDLIRRRKAAAAETLEEAAGLASVNDSPEKDISGRELGAMLRQAISELAPRAAEMFSLRYLEGLTNGEIAKVMETSQAVVAVRLHQSKSKLKMRLVELQREKK